MNEREREREYNLNPYMCIIVSFFNYNMYMHELYTNLYIYILIGKEQRKSN